MFTSRALTYQLLVAGLLIVPALMSSEPHLGQSNKKCADFNEYCQNHWDCCSNSCQSYRYRCTRNYNVFPYDFLGLQTKPTITFDDLLLQTFGDSKNVNNGLRSKRAINGEPENKPLDNTDNKPEIIYLFGDNTNIKNIPYFMPKTEPQENCGEIGAKCYRDDECCSNRCHGFLHKCVT